MLILQIANVADLLIEKLTEYGILGILLGIVVYALSKVYGKNMALVERTLALFESERLDAKEEFAENKEYLKSIIERLSVQLNNSNDIMSRATDVIEDYKDVIKEHNSTYKEMVTMVGKHLDCKYGDDLVSKLKDKYKG